MALNEFLDWIPHVRYPFQRGERGAVRRAAGRTFFLCHGLAVLGLALGWVRAADWPAVELSGSGWRVKVAVPGQGSSFYQGRRFASSGMVPEAWWNGVPVFGTPGENPRDHPDHGGGISDEFDIRGPAGFANTPVGGAFVKIGVGLLKRTDGQPYGIFRTYPMVRRSEIELRRESDRRVVFEEKLETAPSMTAYRMRTSIAIEDGNLVSDRILENPGSELLVTEFYGHNFFRIGDRNPPAGLALVWSQPVEFVPFRDNPAVARLSPGRLDFLGPPEQTLLYRADVSGGRGGDLTSTVWCSQTGLGLRVSTSRPPVRLAMWANHRAVSPEMFLRIEIPPGGSATWRTTYTPVRTVPQNPTP